MVVERESHERCSWVGLSNPVMIAYHDLEWGMPIHEEAKHFEFLVLEGAQAGLSWETVLMKRAGYRAAFYDFDVAKCANMSDDKLEILRSNSAIIRNRLKIISVRKNARAFLDIQKKFGSFDAFVWEFVEGHPRVNTRSTLGECPTETPEACRLSTELKSYGMSFVGPTIMYAYMQAAGLVNDHLITCFRYRECLQHDSHAD